MKVTPIGNAEIMISNYKSKHNFFAWPSAARLQNGKIAVGCSGFRMAHVCPFGKSVLCYSEDEGKTFTRPAPIIDTSLDDRDAGLCPFGENGLILTSFNNTVNFQEGHGLQYPYCKEYLKLITEEQEKEQYGASFVISHDCGVTFGEIHKSPITSPHGPCELSDGTILWVGRTMAEEIDLSVDRVKAYTINPENGEMTYLSTIEPITVDGNPVISCEPHAIQLANGTIICHIRAQVLGDDKSLTLYQAESYDGGKTWTKPHLFLNEMNGGPAHLLQLSDGTVISVYGYRFDPSAVCVTVSTDNCESWETPQILYVTDNGWDMGYPATVELENGDLLTVFYTHPGGKGPAVIMKQFWKLER